MSKTLVIAEKPSVAQDLARALGKCERNGDYFESDSLVISSAVGHLLEIAPPEGSEPARGKWKIENLPSIPPHFDLVPIERNAARLTTLKKLLKRKDVTAVVNACDAGREGELIFRNLVRASGVRKPMSRLWLQSMTPESIRTAFAKLRTDEEMLPLADAATSRAEADWLVGINSTRALTAFNSADGGFHKTTAGRVQTPTLAILAEREEKIRAFKAKTYFEVYGDFEVAAGAYRGRWFDEAFKKRTADEDAKAERVWDKAKAEAIVAKCEGKPGEIQEEKKPTTQAPPLLYDLTTLQREANQRFGFPARMTLQIAQALYEKHKALTYPRTDSRFLPEDHLQTAQHVLDSIKDPTLAVHANKALSKGWVRPNKRIFNNAKVSDHFAIVPTGTIPKSLDDKEQRIFDLVSRRFVAVFFPAAQFEITTRITRVEGEAFKTDGKVIVDPGWLAVYGKQAEADAEEGSEKSVVAVRPGETAQTTNVELKELETKPPARFNEATLLSAMEGAGKFVDDEELREAMSERGLGTPATRAQIIEGLLTEGYTLRQGRELVVTAKGMSLITLLRDLHAEALTKPELTGDWEFRLRQMERGQLSRAEFMGQIGTLTRDLVEKVRAGMGKEVSGLFKPLDVTCPRCGHEGLKESFRCYECDGCKLVVWKTMAARELERDEVIALLSSGKVGPLEGFRSKMGRAFAAHVHMDEGSEWKQRFDFEKSDETQLDLSEAPRLARCPVCHKGQVVETEGAFLCEHAATKACKFRMSRTILQQPIAAEQVLKLCTTGKTDLLRRFISKKGKPFSAFLKLEGEKVGFEFEPRPAKGTKKSAASKAKPEATDQ